MPITHASASDPTYPTDCSRLISVVRRAPLVFGKRTVCKKFLFLL